MPCWDCQEYDPPRSLPSHQETQLQTQIKNLTDRNDDLAAVACVAFNALEAIAKEKKASLLDMIQQSTKPCKTYKEVVSAFAWWDIHKAADARECAKRATLAEKQNLKKIALLKLSPEERKALQDLGL